MANNNDYSAWLLSLVVPNKDVQKNYSKLISALDSYAFYYIIKMDANREADAFELRQRYYYEFGTMSDGDLYFRPCSVFEVMASLALKMEEEIMSNPAYGDRTPVWFWNMVVSMGLNIMDNSNFNENYVEDVITNLLNRTYEPDGTGSLFTLPGCTTDMRQVEIWYQMSWYTNTIK